MARVTIDLPETFPFATELRVRVGDVNYGGHLGNDAVLGLVHEARVRFLAAHGFTELDVAGRSILMVDAALAYRHEGRWGMRLRAEVGVADLRSRGCDLVYRLADAASGEEIARAKTGIVFVDGASRRIVPVPEPFRAAFGPRAAP